MNISDIPAGSKDFLGKIPAGAIYSLILILTATGSFGLGVLFERDIGLSGQNSGGFWIEEVQGTSTLPASVQSAVAAPVEDSVVTGGQYVASKNGTRYYLPWCGGAKQINEENKVWFTTKEDAERAGYTPAKNCKGI
ncbi:hypothetical protein KKH15_03050 [Patescibacteria group bacterium]|nr:hypothetical protein [Patescibacteria group bacterium]MBU1754889.1 hypothetical protein [Patescibacteria group bacterium]